MDPVRYILGKLRSRFEGKCHYLVVTYFVISSIGSY